MTKPSTPAQLWDRCLELIKANVNEEQYANLFQPIAFESFNESNRTLLVQVPSRFICEYLDEHYAVLMKKVLSHCYGPDARLNYRVMIDKTHNITNDVEPDRRADIADKKGQTQTPSQLNPTLTFDNFVEGASNAVSRNIGMAIAEQPNSYRFNPMFVFGPSGSGKTHLINAMGVRMKERYPNKNIRYVSARLFQQEFTTASLQNKINDFIYFYQKMDMLIIDDIQEWMNSEKTQMTFFHIFNHLDLNGRRIILACDRPPVELQGMHERLLTRFRGGFIAPLEKPDAKLCTDILNRWIKREGLAIPADVVEFIAQHANGSVRDLQGVLNSLLLLSINTNCDIDLSMAERVMGYTVKTFDASIAIGDIVEEVCAHYHVQQSKVMSASRKKELVLARQVAMYLARQLTKMPDTKIGKAIANRDHSTVIHSCAQVEQRIAADKTFRAEINALLNACRARA